MKYCLKLTFRQGRLKAELCVCVCERERERETETETEAERQRDRDRETGPEQPSGRTEYN